MKNIKVIVATHKKYQMPTDPMYLPVQVGSEGKEDLGYQRDNEGENISQLNPAFCELTGLYWAWKNLDADYIGLAHYRRHFKGKQYDKDPFKEVLTQAEASVLFDKTDIILTKKRKYYIETIHDHYAHTMYPEPLDEAGKILEEKYPDASITDLFLTDSDMALTSVSAPFSDADFFTDLAFVSVCTDSCCVSSFTFFFAIINFYCC